MPSKPPISKRVRRTLGRIRRTPADLRILARENPLSTLLSVALDRILLRDRTRSVVIHGVRLEVRSLSPDIWVAHDSLGEEFAGLSLAYPKDACGVIVDAGGYIGTAAIALARLYPAASILTIEPCGRNFELLARNIRAFPNIRARKAALTAPGGPPRIAMEDPGEGQWAFTASRRADIGSRAFVEEVDALPIDALLASIGPEPVLIVKLDIEGGELDLFRHPESWADRCPLVAAELHERVVPGCEASFRDCFKGRFLFRLSGEKVAALDRNFFGSTDRRSNGAPEDGPR